MIVTLHGGPGNGKQIETTGEYDIINFPVFEQPPPFMPFLGSLVRPVFGTAVYRRVTVVDVSLEGRTFADEWHFLQYEPPMEFYDEEETNEEVNWKREGF